MFTLLAAGGGVLLTLMIGVVAAGFLGVDPAQLPGLPQLLPDKPVAEVSPQAQPSGSAEPRSRPSLTPGPIATSPAASPTKQTGKPSPSSSTQRGNRPTDRPHPTQSKKNP